MTAMNPVLARKLGLEAPSAMAAADPVSPLRLIRRAVSRAADQSLGMSATVSDLTEDDCDVETMIEDGPEGWVVLGLRDGAAAGLSGLILMDLAVRQAFVDIQTMGQLRPPMADQRPVTRTDAALTVHFAENLLSQLHEVGFGAGRVDPCAYDVAPMDDLRTAGLVMVPGRFLRWRVSLHLGGEIVAGDLILTMRLPSVDDDAPDTGGEAWREAMRASVGEAAADLDAVLCRMRMPIEKIEQFDVGQRLPLAGTTVGSVMLTGPDGAQVATARLGQTAGKRAVRVEQPTVQMSDDLGVRPPAGEGEVPPDLSDPAQAPAALDMPTPPPETEADTQEDQSLAKA